MSSVLIPDLSCLQRASGGYAMLAIDQREAMRAMFATHQTEPVSDAQVTEFKLAAMRTLTPYASAVLIDRQFAWRRAIDEHAVAGNCAIIAAADRFIPDADELVADVDIDYEMLPAAAHADGAVAMKLLILWRPDEPAEVRQALVDTFIERCNGQGLISIIEPVARGPRDGRAWDVEDGVLMAAAELGDRGADLYKAEVPFKGRASEADVRRRCAELTRRIDSPWVVLSSGVEPDQFPDAVRWAGLEGASGFLAGRAVWKNVIGAADVDHALKTDAVDRLRRLCDVVDELAAS